MSTRNMQGILHGIYKDSMSNHFEILWGSMGIYTGMLEGLRQGVYRILKGFLGNSTRIHRASCRGPTWILQENQWNSIGKSIGILRGLFKDSIRILSGIPSGFKKDSMNNVIGFHMDYIGIP